jgi:hypothetical protein
MPEVDLPASVSRKVDSLASVDVRVCPDSGHMLVFKNEIFPQDGGSLAGPDRSVRQPFQGI